MRPLIIFLFAALLLPLSAQAQYTYTTNSGAITITGYSGPGGTVTIPDTINGYPVTSIADDAFWYNNNLTNLIVGKNVLNIGANTFAFSTNLASVIIPNSVTNIGGGAFQYCTNMISITIGNGLLSVGGSAFAFDAGLVSLYFQGNAPTFVSLTSVFYGVTGATIYYNAGTTGWAASYDALSTATIQSQYQYSSDGGAITITNYIGSGGTVAIPAAIIALPVTSIGNYAFSDIFPFLTSVTIPNSVTNIGDEAFVNSSYMTSINIPDSVISMGYEPFAACGLTNIIIPSSVVSIGAAPFEECFSLSAITVSSQNPAYVSAGGVLLNKNQTTLIEYPAGLFEAYAVPNTVTSIGEAAFYNSYLMSIAIPESVTNIGVEAFTFCVSLSAITVDPQNMFFSSVNGALFNKNQTTLLTCPGGLGAYVIPDSATTIGEIAFGGCYGLTNVTIPNSVTTIGAYAFYYAVNLTSITIPSSVISLGYSAFIFSDNLTTIIFQGDPPTLGDAYVFYDVGASAKVYYLAGTTGWGTTYGGLPAVKLDLSLQAQYTYTTNSGAITITGYSGPGGTVTIPDIINGYPVTSIADDAFWYNNNLTNLIVGKNVLNIGANTFAFSTNLASVIIPNSVTNIGGGAFQYCTNMISITIGNGLLSVGGSAFAFDAGLVSLYFQGNAPTFVSLTSVFYGVTGATIYYNAGTTGWAASYDALSTATIQSQYAYTTNSDGLSITITRYSGSGGWVAIPAAITSLPVTSLGNNAFEENHTVTEVIIPNSVTSLGDDVFSFCADLVRVTIADSVASIGDDAFFFCTDLTSITIPENVASIGNFAFADCGLKSVTIPDSVGSIGDDAFANCPNLTKLLFQGNAPALGGLNVFKGVNAAANVYFLPGTTGWGTSYGGAFDAPVNVANGILPTVELYLPVLRNIAVAGGFGFAVTGVTNETIIVEASTNLVNWLPIQTNATPPFQFTDSHWTSYPDRFYRAHYSP